MNANTNHLEAVSVTPVLEASGTSEIEPTTRNERGLTTVEYAIGVILVITIVGVLATTASGPEFQRLVSDLFGVIFGKLTQGFRLPIPGLGA